MPAATGDYLNSPRCGTATRAPAPSRRRSAARRPPPWAAPTPWTQQFKFVGLVGDTRYETSHLVAQTFFGAEGGIGVATGANWPDALAGSAFMGRVYGPLLLVDPGVGLDDGIDPDKGITQGENAMIDANRGSNNFAFVFGGQKAVPGFVDTQLGNDVRTATGLGTAGPNAVFTHPDVASAATADATAAAAVAGHAPEVEVRTAHKG